MHSLYNYRLANRLVLLFVVVFARHTLRQNKEAHCVSFHFKDTFSYKVIIPFYRQIPFVNPISGGLPNWSLIYFSSYSFLLLVLLLVICEAFMLNDYSSQFDLTTSPCMFPWPPFIVEAEQLLPPITSVLIHCVSNFQTAATLKQFYHVVVLLSCDGMNPLVVNIFILKKGIRTNFQAFSIQSHCILGHNNSVALSHLVK